MAADSQASLLMQSALETDADVPTIPSDPLDAFNDASSHSVTDTDVPQYHYHGLATTQTQTQSQDSDLSLAKSKLHDLPPTSTGECPPDPIMARTDEGMILVASTPTPSASQGSQLEDDQDEYGMGGQPDDYPSPAPQRQVSSEPPSSCADLYTKFTPPCADPTQEEVRPCSPTQIWSESSQLEPTQLVATQAVDPPTPSPVAVDVTTIPPGQPRSLLDSLDSNKRARYAHLEQRQDVAPVRVPLPSDWQETQPAFDDGPATPVDSSSRRQEMDRGEMEIISNAEVLHKPSPQAAAPHSRRRRASDTETEPDVVPDSLAVQDRRPIPDVYSLKQEEEEEEDESEAEEEPVPDQPRKRGRGKVPSSIPHQDHPSRGEGSSSKSVTRNRKRGGKKVEEEDETEGETIATETADDDYASPGPSSRKRKRQSETGKPAGRRKPTTLQEASGPASATRPQADSSATRVFAQWNDGCFFSARVQSYNGVFYVVNFDDGTWETMKLQKMRVFRLHCGDIVLGPIGKTKLCVVDVSEFPVGSREEINVSDLRISKEAVGSWGDDRRLQASDIVFGGPSAKPLSQITFSRDKAILKIQGGGGTVIDEWATVIKTGKHHKNKTHCMLDSNNVRVKLGKSDRAASRTPKYLTALALGIPCLNIDIIKDSLKTGEFPDDWGSYLLPGGTSKFLGGPVSQFVGTTVDSYDVKNVWNLPTAFKPFEDASILCVGKEFFTQEALKFVPDIVLAMGAKEVEAVAKLENKTSAASSYTYIIVPTDELLKKVEKRGRYGNCITWDWVKDVLIGRILPAVPRELED
ncbi:hypothetical protein C8F01DRAFT_1132802 [Mycena amicta]|nr:hypothetical protein C8F01DRAFT_1132802 [Mycena amicta]